MLKIDYRLTGSGWAACTIHADGRQCEVSASYLSSCAPLEFGKALCAMADDVLDQYGLAGYKERWAAHDFPVAELDLLKSYIVRWKRNR
jgi:hypothetical protein